MPDGFKKLGDVYRKEPAFGNLRKTVDSADVVEEFNKIFPDLKNVAEPKSVENKTLKLKIENPAWRSELRFNEIEIIKKINKYFNDERIKQIRFIG